MFTGSFRLATNGSASSGGTGGPSGTMALEKVKLALDGYAAQGDAKELAQELLKEEKCRCVFQMTKIGMEFWKDGKFGKRSRRVAGDL